MVLKRQLREGAQEGSGLPVKRRHLVSTIFKGLNHGRTLQESIPCLEPIIRRWVQEAVERAIDPFLKSSYNHIESPGSRSLQLQFHSTLPHTMFTGSRILSQNRSPIKVVLYDSSTKTVITSGPFSSLKVTIVVLDGDFGPDDRDDWTTKEFDSKIVKNREGKRPLVTGELTVILQDGVGYIGEVSFTDNSSWIRSGKFRLGAKIHSCPNDISVREAMSNAFKVKDHRGESYQKHYPPCLHDEVWRLEKIAKDGASHKKLTQFGICSVRDILRLYVTDLSALRTILHKVSNKTWETIIRHAITCTLDENKYMYRTRQGTAVLFNSIYKVVGVTFDGQNYHSVNSLNVYQMRMLDDLKQQAYKNLKELIPVFEPSITGYQMLLPSPAADSITNPSLGLDNLNFHEQDQSEGDRQTMSPSYKTEMEQDNCSFKLGESSHLMQGFRNSFAMSDDSPGGFYIGGGGGGSHHTWPCGGNYMGSPLSTDDLPIDDNFQVESSAWQGNGLFFDPNNHEIGIFSSDSGIVIPRNRRSKTRWCKILAVVKWQILVRRNVAARKWKHFYNYM